MIESNNVNTLRDQLISHNNSESNKLSARQTFFKYISYWPLFLICSLLSFSITYLYLRYKAPVFQSSIKILVTDDSKKSGKDLSTALLDQLVSNGKSNIANELEIVKSKAIMNRVVTSLGLNVIYQSKGQVRETEIYDTSENKLVEFTRISDSSKNYTLRIQIKNNRIYLISKDEVLKEIPNRTLIQTPEFDYKVNIINFSAYRPEYIYKAVWYPPYKMAEALAGQVSAEPLNKDASIMVVSISTALPIKGNDILNGLSYEYAKANVDEKNKTVENTIRFIDERLLLISGELGNVESDLQKFRQRNDVIDVAGQETATLGRLNNTRDQLDQSDIKIQVADMVATYMSDSKRKYSLVPSSLGIEDATLLELVKAYNEQVLQREELLKTLPPGNMAIKSIEGQLELLQSKIIESVNNIKRTYSTAYRRAKAEYDNLMQNINTVPQKEKELLEISRQQGIKEKLYLYLLEKREESALTKASAVANSLPIDKASNGSLPVSPNRSFLYILAFVLGVGLPLLYIYIRNLFNDKVTIKEDILNVTKAPIIGEINHSKVGERKIIVNQSRGVLPEQFRIIRTNLQYFLPNHSECTSILITSSMSSEGKTFFSMNMGAVLSHSNKKVVLIEFDLRKPKIGTALNIPANSMGITNYLTGSMEVSGLLRPVPDVENFFFLPAGPIPPNPAELLLNPQLEKLFSELRQMFDYIIIDSPPVGIVSDAKVLARYSDMNIYIIRQRYTFKKQLELINELYVTQTLTNMALVVNDVEIKGAYGYGGYYNYGYGYSTYNYDYSHEYGYSLESEKKGWWKNLLTFYKKN